MVGARLSVVEHQNLFVRHQAQLGLAHFRLRRVPLHARELLHLPVGQRRAREVGEVLQGGRPLHLARLFGAAEVRAVGGENGARERDGQLGGLGEGEEAGTESELGKQTHTPSFRARDHANPRAA